MQSPGPNIHFKLHFPHHFQLIRAHFFFVICICIYDYLLKYFSSFRPTVNCRTSYMLARSASPTTSRLDENPFFALLIPPRSTSRTSKNSGAPPQHYSHHHTQEVTAFGVGNRRLCVCSTTTASAVLNLLELLVVAQLWRSQKWQRASKKKTSAPFLTRFSCPRIFERERPTQCVVKTLRKFCVHEGYRKLMT